jgi:predicted RNA methylase
MKNINEEHSTYVKLSYFTQGETSPTNKELVEDMILQLERLDDNVLKNPNNTFLDPCAGTGTFGVVLYNKLSQYHTHEWIMKNMIFMVDKSQVNCDILERLGFVNVYKKDFLSIEFNMKFTTVIGNPPFLKGTWKKFLDKALELSTDYVSLISPDNTKTFSSGSDKFNQMLLKNGIQQVTDCTEYFDVESGNIVYYFLNKNEKSNPDSLKFKVEVEKFDEIINYNSPKLNATLSSKRSGKFTRAIRYGTGGEGKIENIESITNDGIVTKFIDISNTHVLDLTGYWVTNRYFGKNEDAPIYEINQTMGVSSNILLIKKINGLTIENFKEIYLSKTFRDILDVLRGKSFDTSPRHLKQLPVLTLEQFYSI